tara:strand:+ start:295 stop:516 length:222 start_codon:yes stop_codon:yes gene_type:complete
MQSWIKENSILSILSVAVILLVLFCGYQSYQIDQLESTTLALESNQKTHYLYLEDLGNHTIAITETLDSLMQR